MRRPPYLRSALSYLRRLIVSSLQGYRSGRNIEIFDDDVFIVSYPRSGNTWARFLLANLREEHAPIDFHTITHHSPDIYKTSSRELKKLPRPRLLKSHEYFHPKYRRVLYIVRDPRSVVVSYFFFLRSLNRLAESISFSRFFDLFLEGRLDSFGPWHEHVGSWMGAKKHSPRFLLVQYEHLKQDPDSQLQRIAKFLSLSVSDSAIRSAIKRSSFQNMQRLEKEFHSREGLPNDPIQPFIRRANNSEWAEFITPTMQRKLLCKAGNVMNELNYIGLLNG